MATSGDSGLPPSADQAPPLPPLSRRRYAVRAGLSVRRKTLLVGAGLLIILAAAPLYGFFKIFVEPGETEVVRVGDVAYTLNDLVSVLRLHGYNAQEASGDFRIEIDPFAQARLLSENELIRQAAARSAIFVSPSDVEREIRERVLGTRVASDRSLPADQIDAEFRERYRQFLTARDISQDLYQRLVEHDLYRAALGNRLTATNLGTIENRASADREQKTLQALKIWLDKAHQENPVLYTFNSDAYAWIAKQIDQVRIPR